MQEKQPTGESIREQTLRRFRSQENARESSKKKKVSAGLIIINLAIIALLFLYYNKNKPGQEYLTSSFNYRDASFRLSMSHMNNTGSYIFYLSTRSSGDGPLSLRFTGGMADLVVLCGQDVIITVPMGRDIAALALKPGESNVQKESVDHHEFMFYAQSHPERLVEGKKSLFLSRRPYLPLKAEVRIHTEQPVSTSLTFKYEVEQ
ncbi:MAG TPA: hypothetical protein PK307_16420 [Spirochaetota bacterium]|nr:hypothetical protein [Spirochaetota bacterium]HOD15331.1 hypothetical protein [Spirochaetota bacterium]HPN12738.1 hypothetical protein [Spirochaetota bacterium]HQL83785.1 hypothetical protein [Spirochaetota bacterium]